MAHNEVLNEFSFATTATFKDDFTKANMATTSSGKSLCFREASTARKERQISDDEYYHHLLNHLAGETHEYDIEYRTTDDYRLAKWDPFCHAVQLVYKEMPLVKGK